MDFLDLFHTVLTAGVFLCIAAIATHFDSQ